MPTESKTATKKVAKRRTKRATAKDAEEKKPRARKATKSRSKTVTDDDFGSGLIEEDAPAKKPAKKARKAAKKKPAARRKKVDAVIDFESDETVEAPKKKPAKKRKVAKKKTTDEVATELDFDSDSSSQAKEEKPKRRSRKTAEKSVSSETTNETEEKKPRTRRSESDSTEADSGSKRRGRGRRSSRSENDSETVSSSRRDEPSNESSEDHGSSEASDSGEKTRSEGGQNNGGGRSESKDPEGEQNRRGRRRRGRRGRGRRGGSGDDRAPQGQRGPKARGRNSNSRDRGPAKDIEPVSAHVVGVLEMHPKGYGFVRDIENDYAAQETDPFVSTAFIDKFNLREGVKIAGEVGTGHRGQGPRLTTIDSIEDKDPEFYLNIKDFDKLTPINPEEHVKLEIGPSPLTMRVVDLLCPIGKGQRALIVAPPRSGKTILLQQIADSVSTNHPECHLMVMLIDERPEEVTEMRRNVNGEVIASSIDRELENHVRVSQLVIERAKRLAEMGKDVFILLDSITRLARAFNKYTNTGRTGSGGIDVRAMDKPKKIFGSARVFDEGGSITVVGTALVDTGSRMDQVIFEEFKGTGNMELVLSRDLADRRIWPAMDIEKSGTRREEKLFKPDQLEGITMMRRSLISLHPAEAMEQLIKTLAKFDTNDEFLGRIRSVM